MRPPGVAKEAMRHTSARYLGQCGVLVARRKGEVVGEWEIDNLLRMEEAMLAAGRASSTQSLDKCFLSDQSVSVS